MYKIYVVSDGTGGTAERALRAALMQFPQTNVEIIKHSHVGTPKQIRGAIDAASRSGGFVLHTLVSDTLRHIVYEEGRKKNVETIDLMGPLLDRLTRQLSVSPSEKPGLFEQLNEAYFRRIETMEFAFTHDDGARCEDLSRAEIVLVGVSRTFKTPLSIYLAFKSWLVANVPIILDMPLPEELFSQPRRKIIALKADPVRLAGLRRIRAERLRGATGEYHDPNFVQREMKYATQIFRKQGWTEVDVTGKAIEEIAAEILAIRGNPGT